MNAGATLNAHDCSWKTREPSTSLFKTWHLAECLAERAGCAGFSHFSQYQLSLESIVGVLTQRLLTGGF
jgi:hypothetical protein